MGASGRISLGLLNRPIQARVDQIRARSTCAAPPCRSRASGGSR
jgi:hypothetical protein